MMSKALDTKEEIADYARYSWEKIERLIEKYNFPARKVLGEWKSHTDLIDEWNRKVVQELST